MNQWTGHIYQNFFIFFHLLLNNLNPKDHVALNLFSQKDLIEALEKAERRIKREKKEKEKENSLITKWTWSKLIDKDWIKC